MKLRSKLLVLTLAVTLGPALAIGLRFIQQSEDILSAKYLERYQQAADATAQELFLQLEHDAGQLAEAARIRASEIRAEDSRAALVMELFQTFPQLSAAMYFPRGAGGAPRALYHPETGRRELALSPEHAALFRQVAAREQEDSRTGRALSAELARRVADAARETLAKDPPTIPRERLGVFRELARRAGTTVAAVSDPYHDVETGKWYAAVVVLAPPGQTTASESPAEESPGKTGGNGAPPPRRTTAMSNRRAERMPHNNPITPPSPAPAPSWPWRWSCRGWPRPCSAPRARLGGPTWCARTGRC